jgi:hypothetical protein
MKPRGILLIALAALAAVLALALLFVRTPGRSGVCPAMGYAYVGDAELMFSTQPVSVAACVGDGCKPAPVTQGKDGRWLVPQSAPYLAPPVSVTSIYVEAAAASGARIARDLPIETESTGEYPFGPDCGGPFRFKPVHVPLG